MVNSISHNERRNLLKVINQVGHVLVIKQKNDRLRMYHPEKYYEHKKRMQVLIRDHKPWVKRQLSESLSND